MGCLQCLPINKLRRTRCTVRAEHCKTLLKDTESLNKWKYTPGSLVEIINSVQMPAVSKSLPTKFQSKMF